MKKDRLKLFTNCIFMFLMIFVGAAVTLQLRTVQAEKKENFQSTEDKLAEYEVRIKELEEEKAALQEEYDRNSAKYTQKLTSLAGTDEDFYSVLDTYESMLHEYRSTAGLHGMFTDIGLTITVNDSISGQDPYNSLLTVHDTTLLMLVNELKAAGAIGISINGERIVPMTEILCVGPAVRVNGTKLFPPYVITAVGIPDQLERAVRESSVFQAISSRLDIKIEKAMRGVANSFVELAYYNKSYKKSIDLLEITEVNPIYGGGTNEKSR